MFVSRSSLRIGPSLFKIRLKFRPINLFLLMTSLGRFDPGPRFMFLGYRLRLCPAQFQLVHVRLSLQMMPLVRPCPIPPRRLPPILCRFYPPLLLLRFFLPSRLRIPFRFVSVFVLTKIILFPLLTRRCPREIRQAIFTIPVTCKLHRLRFTREMPPFTRETHLSVPPWFTREILLRDSHWFTRKLLCLLRLLLRLPLMLTFPVLSPCLISLTRT